MGRVVRSIRAGFASPFLTGVENGAVQRCKSCALLQCASLPSFIANETSARLQTPGQRSGPNMAQFGVPVAAPKWHLHPR